MTISSQAPPPPHSPSVYRPRRPRASPLWQLVHQYWRDFRANYQSRHRATHGPLRPATVATVDRFYQCGDLSAGFTRLVCPDPDCGHERLLAFTCKCRHFCPACHQRRVRSTGNWIAETLCKSVPHRQFVFTIPRILRSIFRKRRYLLDHLFKTATGCLRDWLRTQLDLPDGKLAAIAGVQTFGDYPIFHPHLHILTASGLFDIQGRFHLLPAASAGSLDALNELFRQRFIQTLVSHKLLSEKKARDLLGWKHSGFEKRFIEDSYACRKGKGTHAGMRRAAQFAKRFPYALKCDVRRYFPSIDQQVMRGQLARVIGDRRVLELADTILATHADEVRQVWRDGGDLFAVRERRLGLPIGNLTSQFFANIYLDGFDHFVKQELRVKGYLRYVDDFLLFGESRAELREQGKAVRDYLGGIGLEIHPKQPPFSPSPIPSTAPSSAPRKSKCLAAIPSTAPSSAPRKKQILL